MANSVIQSRAANAMFDLHLSESMQYVQADGVSQVQLGVPLSRLMFHITTEAPTEGQVEQRKAILNLTINTAVLAQVCQQLLISIANSRSQMLGSIQEYDKQLRAILDSLPKP